MLIGLKLLLSLLEPLLCIGVISANFKSSGKFAELSVSFILAVKKGTNMSFHLFFSCITE